MKSCFIGRLLLRSGLPILALLATLNTSRSVLASGFALTEQSVPNLGNAGASGTVGAEDASVLFFNPAGLTRLPGNSVVGAGYLVFPTVRFQNQGSTSVLGTPLLGGEGGDAGANKFLPNLYTSWSLSDRLKLGLGIAPPFGLATDYDEDWVGRYQALRSELITLNFSPTIAAKVTDQVSIGASVNVQYASAELSNAIDFGLIGRSAQLNTVPQQLDGRVRISGDDLSVGYTIGAMYEPSAQTRVGLAYRSAVTHDLEGDADFEVPTAAQALTTRGQFTDTEAAAEVKLPDSLSLGVYHELSPKWAVMSDVTWTNWSRYEGLRIEFENPAQPASLQPAEWKDTVRVGVGVNYKPNEDLTLRAGVAYDPSPVPEDQVTARIPDADRTWVAAGVSYQATDSVRVDLSYAHLFFGDREINQTIPGAGTLRGGVDSDVDVISAQVNWSF
uniref:OmpP1/FadL family transporter n=1 Tax=Trichocoleus desertorum TaxID=1481672 RepID=UPI0025B42D65|nr:outer membrane protein transport protein [Trichocoleus desertorum]